VANFATPKTDRSN